MDGTVALLDKPEFSDVDSLKRVFRAFDEKARLLDLVTRYLDAAAHASFSAPRRP